MKRHALNAPRKAAFAALILGLVWLGAVIPTRGDGTRGDRGWAPRVTLTDERGSRHEGTLERFALEVKGHPTVVPTERFELNGAVRATSDLRAVRLTWTAGRGPADKAPLALGVAFEFSDGSVLAPRIPRGGPAPVTALSFTFADTGGDRLEWSFRLGEPLRGPLGRIARIEVSAQAEGSPPSTLCLRAFDDANANGARDKGEVALARRVFLLMGGTLPPTTISTGPDGSVCTSLPAGKYRVSAVRMPGWSATTPEVQDVAVAPGQTLEVAFGSRQAVGETPGETPGETSGETPGETTGELCILAFEDGNRNGVRDRGEAGLPDWQFTVTGPRGARFTMVTGRDGSVCAKAPAGHYVVVQAAQWGWRAGTPTEQGVSVLAERQARLSFGNSREDGGGVGVEAGVAGKLCILKFEDLDGNGVQDRGEVGLGDWRFTVTDVRGASTTLVTKADGWICAPFPAGRYEIAESDRAGWSATTASRQTVVVSAREGSTVTFGNRRGKQPQTEPPGVVVDTAGCDCHLGAIPTANAVLLRWGDLCPLAVSRPRPNGGPPNTAYVFGEPRLYRTDHGVGNWQRILPSSGTPATLTESSLATLPVPAADQELFRDVVRHYQNPEGYVETPLPAGTTLEQAAADIRDFSYVVLVTRFGLTLDGMEAMGLGIVDTAVSSGRLYDYVLTVWTPELERQCGRVDGVGPMSPPAVPPPTGLRAAPLTSRMPDQPGARRPDSQVTPIGVIWTSALSPSNPPTPPYVGGAFDVVAYVVERMDGPSGAWTKIGGGPVLEDTDHRALQASPSLTPDRFRFLDIQTEDRHAYRYRVRSLDMAGRTSVPSVVGVATAYRIPAPLPWTSFTVGWNVGHAWADVVLTLDAPLPANQQLWVERTQPTTADPDAGLVRLNPAAPWSGAALSFALTDAAVTEKSRYAYKVVIDGPVAGSTIDMNIRAMLVVPDLTPPPAPAPLQYLLRPGTRLPDAVTAALVEQSHLDQNDLQKWEDAVREVTEQIAAERALLEPQTLSSTETVTITRPCGEFHVALDALEGRIPDVSAERLPYPPRAEVLYTNGERVQGVLTEFDLEGPSLGCHLLPDRAPVVCDGRSLPWDEVDSISLLWAVFQPTAGVKPLRKAFPSITDTRGDVAFPKTPGGTEAAGLTRMHVRLQALAGGPDVTWDFDAARQVPGARELRQIRLLDTPWKLSTRGKTFTYLWSDPTRRLPPEGMVTRVEIDPTAAPGRKATVSGSAVAPPGAAASPSWSVRGHLVSLGLATHGSKVNDALQGLCLDANSPGLSVTIDGTSYALDDLIRVEVTWRPSGTGPSPSRFVLTFHHQAELRVEDLPVWPEADIKARALSRIEAERYQPHMPAILASREGVILYWSYPPPADPTTLAGFHLYRATSDAPTVFTRINAAPLPLAVVTAPLSSPPAGWPPSPAGSGSLCWFEDALFGGVGTQYAYLVTAVDDTGLENPPSPAQFPPPPGAALQVTVPDRAGPPPPVFVSVQKQYATGGTPVFQGVRTEWRKPQHPYDVVLFRTKVNSGAPATAVFTAPATSTVTSFLDTGPFQPLERYEYFLRGDSGGVLGKPGVTRTVLIRADDIPPVPSFPLTAVAAAGSVALTWGAPALPVGVTVKHYVIERREAGAAPFRLRAGPMTSTSFLDDRVQSGVSYEYRIVLIDSSDALWLTVYAPAGAAVP